MHRILFLGSGGRTGTRAQHGDGRRVVVRVAGVLAALFCCGAGGSEAANFEVRGAGVERCQAVLSHAEAVRDRAFATLLGEESPRPWVVRCEIHLHGSVESFTAAVGGPPADARGATSIEFAGADAVLRRIDVMDEDSAMFPDALAHELVHVVLADRFTARPPPRWADEGLAILFDPAGKQAGHDDDFQAARRAGMTWSLTHLVDIEELPTEPYRQRVFYGQSAALVRWLLARGGPRTFVAFLDDAASAGVETALERHYGLNSLAALERAWLASPAITDVGLD